MQAIVYDNFGAEPAYRSVPPPHPAPHGVVLRVDATGLCRSDWHGWQGHDPMIDPPHVPGHEVAGTIVECGADVTEWAGGERVTVPFVGGCGRCAQCRAGRPQVCPNQFQPGFSGWGTFAERVAIDYADANLVALPDGLGPVAAAALGCRFATAFRAVVDQGDVAAGDEVAVHGCGGVGLSAILIASAAGARVVAVDISEAALSLAASLGAAHTIDATNTGDVVAAVRAATGGGAHLSLDALGHPDTCRHSIAGLRTQGRHVQVGLLGADAAPAVPMSRVIAEELELRGTHGLPAHRYPALLSLVTEGPIDPSRLVRRTIPLRDAGTALTRMDRADTPGITVVDELP
ncbi:MAG: zinc-dependent alcohol dehydrogenase family protein [Salinibacter sp.]